jgi:hypothetical protein
MGRGTHAGQKADPGVSSSFVVFEPTKAESLRIDGERAVPSLQKATVTRTTRPDPQMSTPHKTAKRDPPDHNTNNTHSRGPESLRGTCLVREKSTRGGSMIGLGGIGS